MTPPSEDKAQEFELEFEPIRIKLSDRNKFTASLIGIPIAANIIIAGEGKHKTLPKCLHVTCVNCDLDEKIELIDFSKDSTSKIINFISKSYKDLKNEVKMKYKLEMCGDPGSTRPKRHVLVISSEEFIDFREYTIRDIPERTSNPSPVNEYIEAFGVGKMAKTMPLKKYDMIAIPISHPKTDELSLYITNVAQTRDEYDNYTPSDEDKINFKKYFYQEIDPIKLKESYLTIKDKINRSHAPYIVQCEHSKMCDIVVLHSTQWIIKPDGNQVRGWLRGAKYGDTGTGKGSLIRYIFYEIGLGERFVGESSGRTGLMYSIDVEKKRLIWGALVLNDGGLVLIEGFHGQHAEEIAQQREALDQGIVKVDRYVSGEANARTRIICDMNPYVEISSAGIYKCEALFKLPSIKESPDIRRWDLWVVHYSEQASHKEIAKAVAKAPYIPNEVMRKHALLSWKNKEIVWGKDVEATIQYYAEHLLTNYKNDILPLINNSVKDLLYRLTISFAQITDSFIDNYTKIHATTNHVQLAYIFLIENIKVNEFDMFSKDWLGKHDIKQSEIMNLIKKLIKTDLDILESLKRGSLTAGKIGEMIDKTKETVYSRVSKLSIKELISAKSGRGGGYILTSRGIKVVKLLSEPNQRRIVERKKIVLHIKPKVCPKCHGIGKIDLQKCGTCEGTGGVKCPMCKEYKQLTHEYDLFDICNDCVKMIEASPL